MEQDRKILLQSAETTRHSALVEAIKTQRFKVVFRNVDIAKANDLIWALHSAGVMVIEFTLDSPNAFRLIDHWSQYDNLFVGAGTCKGADDVIRARNVGACYVASPFARPDFIDQANSLKIASFAGVRSPNEMDQAWERGATFMKVFPGGYNDEFKSVVKVLNYMNAVNLIDLGAHAVAFSADDFLKVRNPESVAKELIRQMSMVDRNRLAS
jgi:2-keto-3-deoxy-6-phosphogluconate aldolase